MNRQTAQVDDLRLVALPSAVNCTDLFVRFSLTEWSLPIMFDDATKAARLLVQAVVDTTDARAPGFVTVRLRLSGDCLVIEVEDDQRARVHDTAPQVPGRRTGAVPLEGRGKLVWCEVPLPGGISADSVRLPHRGDRRSQTGEYTQQPEGNPAPARHSGEQGGPQQALPPWQQQSAGVDPALVDRVLVGLKRQEW
ncbi:ATP-binding protein [Saccharomonospora sp. NPDC006951]